MSVVDSILNFTSNFGNIFWNLIQSINSIWQSIINVFSYIFSILKALWLWLTSLLSPIWELISDVLWNGAISSLAQSIDRISGYIWWPATIFIMTLFVLVLTRIVIAFVFKIFRLNLDYKTNSTQWKEDKQAREKDKFQKEYSDFKSD